MTHTHEALQALRLAVDAFPRAVRLPTAEWTARAVRELGAGDAARGPPVEAVLEAARARIVAEMRRSPRSPEIGRRDLRDAPWLLWSGRQPLAEAYPALVAVVAEEAPRTRSVARNLIEAWLAAFQPEAPRIAEAGFAIRRLLGEMQDSRFDQWRSADREVALFDAGRGPGALAARLLEHSAPVADILKAAGFDDPLRGIGGYMRAVQTEILELSAEVLRGRAAEAAFARLEAFLAPEPRPRFSEATALGEMARGLLAPWLGGGREPPETVRDLVRNFLLRHLGDPRIRPQAWNAAGEAAAGLMRRWLARASFRAFFDLIDELASDHQWRFREAFWSAYLERGLIDDVWLALGANIHANARSISELNGAYGALNGSGQQAVLLMRVREIVICEWSNSGALRAWPTTWKSAPRIGERSYSRTGLISKCLPFPAAPDGRGLYHHGGPAGGWQARAATFLAEHTGARLTYADWMPR